jgi:hypothetical protein
MFLISVLPLVCIPYDINSFSKVGIFFEFFLMYLVSSGAKLCMISDLLGDSGSVTGVDVARHRLAACRTMLQKYALGDRCRLFVADGTAFSLLPVGFHSESKSCNQSGK